MNKERLSQLIDGELDALDIEPALDELLASPELQRSWQTMHLMRAGMDAEASDVSLSIADKVSAMLEDEPVIMAPNNIALQQASPGKADNVIPMSKNRPKAWALLAVAASVAALVMLSYSPQNRQTTPAIADSNESAAQPLAAMELQSMIVQHGEFSGAAALNGLAAYAKVVNGSTSRSIQ